MPIELLLIANHNPVPNIYFIMASFFDMRCSETVSESFLEPIFLISPPLFPSINNKYYLYTSNSKAAEKNVKNTKLKLRKEEFEKRE